MFGNLYGTRALDTEIRCLVCQNETVAASHAELAVDLRCDAHHTALTISDCGPGIEPELAARLFQPFSAGDVRSGSGLGLAICQEIVQALGGSITLTNREQGTRILGLDAVVRLPLAHHFASAAHLLLVSLPSKPSRSRFSTFTWRTLREVPCTLLQKRAFCSTVPTSS